MDHFQHLRIGKLRIVSNHKVLDQVARDIAVGIDPAALPDQRINVYIGIHRELRSSLVRPGLRIGIQTEQYYGADGKRLWRVERRWRMLMHFLRFHLILDLSEANRPHYDWLPEWAKKRVYFGPHIFPSRPVDRCPGTRQSFVFFGAPNGRRSEVLAALPQGYCDCLPVGTYGPALADAINASAGVVNIHYHPGVYTEFPRLLSAYLHGKICVSEPLGPELVAGQEYGLLGIAYGAEAREAIFARFRDGFAARHRFTDFLRMACKIARRS